MYTHVQPMLLMYNLCTINIQPMYIHVQPLNNLFIIVNVDQNDPKMDHILKQKSLRCLIRCINFNIDAVRVIRNCLLTMSKFQLPGKKPHVNFLRNFPIDDLLFIYETSAQTMLKVLSKYHVPPKGIRHDDAQFLTNMVIQFANQFVCQVDLNLKLATRRIKFIGMLFLPKKSSK